ncbi:chaperone modulator CbpM [Zhouia sp. PK063]|uniref:chaperone modulator CbpM n=1 Tax=Zhouia sp. PK063 TaxID=3373602 RepID=UPI0037B80B1C
MSQSTLISITTFCKSHDIEVTFIHELASYDLVELVKEDNDMYITSAYLPTVEKLMRLHYDLQINMEGLNAIQHLLYKIDGLQQQVQQLQNKLSH